MITAKAADKYSIKRLEHAPRARVLPPQRVSAI
jgi:hypothetical protein